MSLHPLNQGWVVPVVDALTGQPKLSTMRDEVTRARIPIRRHFRAAPLHELWPDVGVILINWEPLLKSIREALTSEFKALKEQGQSKPDFAAEYRSRVIEALQRPIEFEGKTYYGWWAWGSSVKAPRLTTIGLTRDFAVEAGLVKGTEDAPRCMRSFLPSAIHGGVRIEKARILVLKKGDIFHGHVVEDGFSLIKESVFKAALHEEAIPTILRQASQNYLNWQRFQWDRIQPEAEPLILQGLAEMGSPEWHLREIDRQSGVWKRELIQIEPELRKHPHFQSFLTSGARMMMMRTATTVPVPTWTKMAVPTLLDTPVVYGPCSNAHILLNRYPGDSWASLTGEEVDAKATKEVTDVDGNEYTVTYLNEVRRIRKMVVLQTSGTARILAEKGMKEVVPDSEMGDYDLVICCEDVKMLANVDVREWRKEVVDYGPKELEVEDYIVAVTQWYAPGSCVGLPPEMWKVKGGDFDGDFAFVSPANHIPLIWAEAASFKGRDKSYKIKKGTDSLDKRPGMIADSFDNMIGLATTVMARTFTVQPDDREEIARLLHYKGVIGIDAPTVEAMDFWLNRAIKNWTDQFKSPGVNVTMEALSLRQAITQFIQLAAWSGWAQPDSPAFSGVIPLYMSELPEQMHERAEQSREYKRSPEYRTHIPDTQSRGTIAKIYDLTRPWILSQYLRPIKPGLPNFISAIETEPLSSYIGWVPEVPDVDLIHGVHMVERFATLSASVSWESDEAAIEFKEDWQSLCEKWSLRFPSKLHAVYVLWRASHHARTGRSSASAVFLGFPKEVMDIVLHKPGLAAESETAKRCVVTGMDKNFVSGQAPDLISNLEVKVDVVLWAGELRRVIVAVGDVQGLVEVPSLAILPERLLGFVASAQQLGNVYHEAPAPGNYLARTIRRNKSGKTHTVYLEPTA